VESPIFLFGDPLLTGGATPLAVSTVPSPAGAQEASSTRSSASGSLLRGDNSTQGFIDMKYFWQLDS
jgi:hypothetical protein